MCKITLLPTALIRLLTREFVGENKSLEIDKKWGLNCGTNRETFGVSARKSGSVKFKHEEVCAACQAGDSP